MMIPRSEKWRIPLKRSPQFRSVWRLYTNCGFFFSVQDIRQVKYTFCTTFASKRYTNHLHAFSLGYWYKTYAKSSAPFVQLSRVSGTPSIYMHLVLGIASAWCCSKPPASSRMRTFLHATDKVYIVYHQAVTTNPISKPQLRWYGILWRVWLEALLSHAYVCWAKSMPPCRSLGFGLASWEHVTSPH